MTTSLEFEALMSLRGSRYVDARDGYLARAQGSAAARADLEHKARASEWRTATMARILLGWLDRRGVYEKLMADIDAEDWDRAARTIKGHNLVWDKYAQRAATEAELGPNVLPLCWEAILAHTDEWPQRKVILALRMIGAVPDERSIEPVIHYLEHGAEDYLMRNMAVQVLSRMPAEAAGKRVAKLRAKHADIQQAIKDVMGE